MSRTAFWILAASVLVILAGGAYLVVLWKVDSTPEPVIEQEPDPFELPPGSIGIGTTDGGTVPSRDFLKDESVKAQEGNPGGYVLAGAYTLCAEGTECAVVETDEFNIRYSQTDDSFVIGLAKEPVGEVRRSAEAFLMAKTGFSESEMCRLKYYVGTTYWVNETYAGQNLGFSFCPGAVRLP